MAVYTKIDTQPAERGTVVITAVFKDENGNLATPKTLFKKLTDSSGNVMNGINTEIETALSSTITFVLTGDDLAINGTDITRHFLLTGTYDSSAGEDLYLQSELIFDLRNMVGL